VNLAAENQIRTALDQQSVAAILLHDLGSFDGQSLGQRGEGEKRGGGEAGESGKTHTSGKAHGKITPEKCNRIHRFAQAPFFCAALPSLTFFRMLDAWNYSPMASLCV
jgi:hypothetical protein